MPRLLALSLVVACATPVHDHKPATPPSVVVAATLTTGVGDPTVESALVVPDRDGDGDDELLVFVGHQGIDAQFEGWAWLPGPVYGQVNPSDYETSVEWVPGVTATVGVSDLFAIGIGGGNSDAGMVEVWSGETTTATGGATTTFLGASGGYYDGTQWLGGDAAGTALAAGDFDADGLTDLAIGAPGWDPSGESGGEFPGIGAVYVELAPTPGQFSLLSGVGPALRGEVVDEATGGGTRTFGAALSAGDLDGDGYDDLAVRDDDSPEGARVLVYAGPDIDRRAEPIATRIELDGGPCLIRQLDGESPADLLVGGDGDGWVVIPGPVSGVLDGSGRDVDQGVVGVRFDPAALAVLPAAGDAAGDVLAGAARDESSEWPSEAGLYYKAGPFDHRREIEIGDRVEFDVSEPRPLGSGELDASAGRDWLLGDRDVVYVLQPAP